MSKASVIEFLTAKRDQLAEDWHNTVDTLRILGAEDPDGGAAFAEAAPVAEFNPPKSVTAEFIEATSLRKLESLLAIAEYLRDQGPSHLAVIAAGVNRNKGHVGRLCADCDWFHAIAVGQELTAVGREALREADAIRHAITHGPAPTPAPAAE